MAGQGRLRGYGGGFQVPDFAHQDDVRVLAQERAQGRRESYAGKRVDLHLVDAGQPVLNRVLDRHDVDVLAVQGLQGRVQRCGLSRAGRAGDEKNAVRRVYDPAYALKDRLGKIQVLEPRREHELVLAEQAQNHLFPVNRGHA